MTTVNMTLKIEGDLSFFKKGLTPLISEPMKHSLNKTLDESEKEAKKVYLEKRKAIGGKSAVIGSFVQDNAKTLGKFTVKGILFAGGPDSKAPWTIFLEDDHRLRNGKMWSTVNPEAPYKFMDAALKKAQERIIPNLLESLRLGGIISV